MNLRTLKKLSKRAAPLLLRLGDTRQQFPASKFDGCLSSLIGDRKHWDRSGCHPSYEPHNQYSTAGGMPLKHVSRAGRTIVIRPPSEPRKGTMMVGAMSGYYEPEWDEETAWEALSNLVWSHFTDWSPEAPVSTRDLYSPSEILRGVADMIAAQQVSALADIQEPTR